ncbi:MAG: hypothetical protein KJO43_11080 [Phycisphaerae bacterium]|nr:hypothetical protein [Phycisphaerae bacterium]
MNDAGKRPVEGVEAAELRRSLPCRKCRYDLRGLAIGGVCPECGLAVVDSVRAAIDPMAGRLPRLTNPRSVGNALLWLIMCLDAAAIVLTGRALGLRLDALGRPHLVEMMPRGVVLGAVLVAVAALPAVVLLAPPREAEGIGVVRRNLWRLGGGLLALAAGAATAWALASELAAFAEIEESLLLITLALGIAATMLPLRGILQTIGERSRQYRTARSERQRAIDMVAAAVGMIAGETVRLAVRGGDLGILATLGGTIAWISALMALIGFGYLTVNAVWIRRALRRPPPTLHELVTRANTDEG